MEQEIALTGGRTTANVVRVGQQRVVPSNRAVHSPTSCCGIWRGLRRRCALPRRRRPSHRVGPGCARGAREPRGSLRMGGQLPRMGRTAPYYAHSRHRGAV